jgi:hypothetical protein
MIKLLDLTNPRHQQIVAEEIARAKRIIKEATAKKLDYRLFIDWMQNNKEVFPVDFTYTSGGSTKDYSKILAWLDHKIASQDYLEGLLKELDQLDGVDIDRSQFEVKDVSSKPNIDHTKMNREDDPRSIFPGMPLD